MEKNNNFLSRSHVFLRQALVISLVILIAETPATNADKHESYVRTACNKTTFPARCFNSLKPFSAAINSRPLNLCKFAAQVALADARVAKSGAVAFSKTKGLTHNERAVASDCNELTDSAADEVSQSYHAFADGSFPGAVTVSDVSTWVSAAITDDFTCTDDMEEMELSPAKTGQLKKLVDKAQHSASILLDLFTLSFRS